MWIGWREHRNCCICNKLIAGEVHVHEVLWLKWSRFLSCVTFCSFLYHQWLDSVSYLKRRFLLVVIELSIVRWLFASCSSRADITKWQWRCRQIHDGDSICWDPFCIQPRGWLVPVHRVSSVLLSSQWHTQRRQEMSHVLAGYLTLFVQVTKKPDRGCETGGFVFQGTCWTRGSPWHIERSQEPMIIQMVDDCT